MSMQTYEWTPPEPYVSYYGPNDPRGDELAARHAMTAYQAYEQAMSWKPPAGHASWCDKQTSPGGLKRYHLGDTPMAQTNACNCGKSTLAKTLRKVNAR